MVDLEGIEPPISGCKPDVFPLALQAQTCRTVGVTCRQTPLIHTPRPTGERIALDCSIQRETV